MSEIKPVYQVRTVPHGWKEIPEEKYQNALDNLEIDGRLLYPAAAYEALKAENEALRKQVDEHKEWHMMRDEMRKALEAQMNGDSK